MSLQAQCEAALSRPADAPAIEFQGEWVTWGWMRRTADAVNAALDAAGVGPRDPVGFVPRNRPSAAAAMIGMIARGRTLRMIYVFQTPAGIARDVGRMKLRAVVAAAEDLGEAVQAVAREQGLAAVALDETGGARLLPGLERATAIADPEAPASPQLQILTSGTTGPPKSFAVDYAMIERFIVGGSVQYAASATPIDRLAPGLIYFPFGNISGIYNLLPPAVHGQRMVLLEKFNVSAWRDYVVRHRPERTGLPPAAFRMVLDADIPEADLASLEAIGAGAAPLDPAVQRAFEDRYGIPILLSYGATEFGGPVTAMTLDMIPDWGRSKLGSVGRPFAGARLRVLDPDTGEELPPGREGLLEVSTPRIGPHWIRTTDIVLIDEDGFMFHRGRADGAIVRGGFKLLPEVIERALLLHPAVAAASVVGLDDPRLGQVPAAAIQLRPGAETPDKAALDTHLREHVYATHIPVTYRMVEELPRTPSLKIDLAAVRRLLADAG